jgi:hypothetical protein
MIAIPLTKGHTALVDDCDAHLASFRWQAKVSPSSVVHAQRARSFAERAAEPGPRTVYLHREILRPPADMEVDHVNGDGRDCRRGNLRLATKPQNAQNVPMRKTNTSGLRGVSKITRHKNGREVRLRKPWLAQIRADGRYEYLGLYATPEEASHAYEVARSRLHGAFARPDDPVRRRIWASGDRILEVVK